MKILAIETATAWQSVAILDESGVLAQHGEEAGGAHGALLLPTIDRLLTQAQVRLHELSGLVCSAGPGSFTGIRVGLATGLGLRAATGLPLVLVPTLEAMASNVDGAIPICPVLPSRRGEVYWAIFRRSVDGRVERVLGEQVGTEQAFVQSLPEPTLVCGAGWATMAPETHGFLAQAGRVTVGSECLLCPSAVSVGRLGMVRLHRGEIAGELVAPLYVQRAEAEIQYERSGGLSSVARRQSRVERKTAERLVRGRKRSRV